MKITILFLCIVTADAVNRLQLFNKHHNGRLGQLKNGKTTRGRDKLSSLFFKRRMMELIRKKTVNAICNSKTCNKCNKLVGKYSGLATKYCQRVISMPNCCSRNPLLLGQFWEQLLQRFKICKCYPTHGFSFNYLL